MLAAVALASASARAGNEPARRPVPEFARTAAVALSGDLFNYGYQAPELAAAIEAAGASVVVLAPQPGAARTWGARKTLELPHGAIWLREFGGFPFAEAGGGAPERLRFVDFTYDAALGEADAEAVAPRLAAALGAQAARSRVPLDGGNFLTDGRTCVISTPVETTLATRSPEVRDVVAARNALREAGCPEVLVVEAPPHAHVDMWMKIVGPRQVLVNEISAATLAAAREFYGRVTPELLALKTSLDEKARFLARRFTVHRLPMPLPYRGVFRTYANALLVNGRAIVPRYTRFGWGFEEYPDSSLAERYEAGVRKAFGDAGFAVAFVAADGMIYNGGAFHCVTLNIPELKQ
jgi:agmatine/peptidylarginine deiminase